MRVFAEHASALSNSTGQCGKNSGLIPHSIDYDQSGSLTACLLCFRDVPHRNQYFDFASFFCTIGISRDWQHYLFRQLLMPSGGRIGFAIMKQGPSHNYLLEKPHSTSVENVLRALNTRAADGLSLKEAITRQTIYGLNRLRGRQSKPVF